VGNADVFLVACLADGAQRFAESFGYLEGLRARQDPPSVAVNGGLPNGFA